jgi:hypothetical protein
MVNLTPEIKPSFFLSSSWIVIGLSIHFKKWIWIFNHMFVLDLDWIYNKKNGLSKSLPTLYPSMAQHGGGVCHIITKDENRTTIKVLLPLHIFT